MYIHGFMREVADLGKKIDVLVNENKRLKAVEQEHLELLAKLYAQRDFINQILPE